LRRLYEDKVNWYKDIAIRAQLMLTIDGVFASFISAAVLAKGRDLRTIIHTFGPETWAILSLLALALVGGIVSVVASLSPGLWHVRRDFNKLTQDGNRLVPGVLWWGGYVAQIPEEGFIKRCKTITPTEEAETLASQVARMSRQLTRKYTFLAIGSWLTAVSIIAFVGVALDYFIRIA